MKVTINTTEPKSREIDWSKPMVVISKSGYYVITNGIHDSATFEGMDLHDCSLGKWSKRNFTPCTSPVTITFENEL
jgi:hypothetical protein